MSQAAALRRNRSEKAQFSVHAARGQLHSPLLLATSPAYQLLSGLAKPDLDIILKAATHRRYAANTVIAHQGHPADYFYLLVHGCARLFYITESGQKILLRWLSPGEPLGGVALLEKPTPYLVSTEMVKESDVLIWPREVIRNLASRYPKLLDNALPFALDHLTWFLASHLALVSQTARERLAHVLLSLAKGIGHESQTGIRLEVTNEQLANAANITPFTASRLISEWRRDGVITKKRGYIEIRFPIRLFLQGQQ
jgi:CRP-like cAMP-binding protein